MNQKAPEHSRKEAEDLLWEEKDYAKHRMDAKYKWFSPKVMTKYALAIFLVFAIFWLVDSTRNVRGILNEYFLPFPAAQATSLDDSDNQTLAYAYHMYSVRKYNVAERAFKEYLSHHQDDDYARFYLAIVQIARKHTEAAIQNLQAVQGTLPQLDEQIEWYLGLAYLQAKERDHAGEIFKGISQSDGRYKSQAKDILEKL